VYVEDTTFVGNDAAQQGGAMWVNLPSHSTTCRRCDFIDNEGDKGGAVYAVGTIVKLQNDLFDGNNGVTSAGAVYLDSVSGEISQGVLYQDTSPDGAGVRISNGIGGLTIKNTAFRELTTGAALKITGGSLPTVKYDDWYLNTTNFSGISNQVGINGNIAVGTGFVNAAAGDFHLTATSGLKDKGDPAVFDTNGSRSDIGIYGGPYGW
jgi:hypothetical protein